MNRCVCCGVVIPEGGQYCQACKETFVEEKIELGKIVMTNGIGALVKEDFDVYFQILGCLIKHQNGDWGELCKEDKQYNEDAVVNGNRVMSCYYVGKDSTKIWIITEWDRSVTTVLLPEEY